MVGVVGFVSGVLMFICFLLCCIYSYIHREELGSNFDQCTISDLGKSPKVGKFVNFYAVIISILNIIFFLSWRQLYGQNTSVLLFIIPILASIFLVYAARTTNKAREFSHEFVSWVFFVLLVVEELILTVGIASYLGSGFYTPFGIIVFFSAFIGILTSFRMIRESGVVEIFFLGINVSWIVVISFMMLLRTV